MFFGSTRTHIFQFHVHHIWLSETFLWNSLKNINFVIGLHGKNHHNSLEVFVWSIVVCGTATFAKLKRVLKLWHPCLGFHGHWTNTIDTGKKIDSSFAWQQHFIYWHRLADNFGTYTFRPMIEKLYTRTNKFYFHDNRKRRKQNFTIEFCFKSKIREFLLSFFSLFIW